MVDVVLLKIQVKSDRLLEDSFYGSPLLFRGLHTGALFITDFPFEQIEFQDDLSPDMIQEEPSVQEW